MTSIFNDKVCVVTGAASGIGRAIAIKLAKDGAMLALSDVDAEGLKETSEIIGAASNHIRIDTLNVADEDEIAPYPAIVEESLGEASYVFNVAGLTRVGTFVDSPLSSFENIMDVNFWGVVRMSKAFLPQLQKTKGGIVNISSLFGLIGYAGQSHYCASKFAVRGFSETIAAELEEHGVSVTSVHPGGVATAIARNAKVDALPAHAADKKKLEDEFDEVAKTSPEKAAEIILNGAAKRKRRVLVGNDAKVISFLQRMFPQSYHRLLGFVVNKRIAQ